MLISVISYLPEVKVVERSTEGLHSLIKRSLARAPRASTGYLSLELRFAQLMMYAVEDVHGFRSVEHEFQKLGTFKGFRETVLYPGLMKFRTTFFLVCSWTSNIEKGTGGQGDTCHSVQKQTVSARKTLNLKLTDSIARLSDRQLSELLYRDDLVLKHSASTHIRSTVKQLEDAAASVSKNSAKAPSSAGATLVAALIDFLIQARLGTCGHFSLRFTVIFDLLLVKRLLIVQVQVKFPFFSPIVEMVCFGTGIYGRSAAETSESSSLSMKISSRTGCRHLNSCFPSLRHSPMSQSTRWKTMIHFWRRQIQGQGSQENLVQTSQRERCSFSGSPKICGHI